ncbi:MAG: hypothetical protein M0Z42_25510 [Actinomycetota bacterium]|nr:hypothetical protein [Actinomycetota bacterium]
MSEENHSVGNGEPTQERSVTNILDEAGAIQAAWRQVDPEALAAILRKMSPKLRNQMLSATRVPTSKVTPATARLLMTALARRRSADAFRAARTITHPLAVHASDVLHDALSLTDPESLVDPESASEEVLAEMGLFIEEHLELAGPSVLVLAAVGHTYAESARFTPLLVACGRAGLLTAGLAEAVAEIEPLVPGLVAGLLESEFEPITSASGQAASGDGEQSLIELLEDLWRVARGAAQRVRIAVRAGRVPAEQDLAVIAAYAEALAEGAERLEVAATMEALLAAVPAEEAAPLDSLAGPERLAEQIEAVKAAQRLAIEDAELAGRLDTFVQLIDAADPMDRLEIAGKLRGTPPPPAPELVDAALAGMLTFAVPPEGEAAGAAGETGVEGEPATDVSAEEALPEETPAHPVAAEQPVEDKAPAGPRGAVPESEPEPIEEAEPVEETEPAEEPRTIGEAEPVEEVAPKVQVVAAQGPGDVEAPRVEQEAQVPRAAPVREVAEVAAEPTLSDEDIAAELARLVRDQRFGLAHHLALAAGRGYHAEILKECALANAVRTAGSPASAAMVVSVAEQPVNPADVGSVVLRCAALLRVALLDPGSGAAQQLRQLIGELGSFRALQEFAGETAQAADQMVPVSAGGEDLDESGAIDEAEAIASWARDTLERPLRQIRLYRGIEIWKQWSEADGPLARALRIVADNEASRVREVRALCEPFAGRKAIADEIDQADKGLRSGRSGKAKRIIGPAKEQLIRLAEELVSQLLAWCDARGRASDTEHGTGISTLALSAGRLRPQVVAELDALGGDSWLAAAARAAKDGIEASMRLLANEALGGQELDPSAALNRGLALVEGLPLGPDLEPLVQPTLPQLVVAASRSRSAAFDARVAARDFGAAEALIDLQVGPGEGFDTEESRRRLRAAERDARTQVQQDFERLEQRFSAARARGCIDEGAAARLYGELLGANPDSGRRDLGQVEAELAAVGASLAEAIAERGSQVQDDIEAAIAEGQVSEPWAERLRSRVAEQEMGSAEEYLYRAMNGEPAPAPDVSEMDRHVSVTAAIDAWPEGLEAGIAEAAREGSVCGPIDFAGVAAVNRQAVAEGLGAWMALAHGPRPEPVGPALEPILRLLGLVPTGYQRSTELRSASTPSRWFVDVVGNWSGKAFVPDYGSRSKGRRRFLICWDNLSASQLWATALAGSAPDQPVYVLLMHTLSLEGRAELARESRRQHTGRVVVIDDAVVACCAEAGTQTWDVTMRAVLPYSAPNPYDPDVQVTPEEMFYGRQSERDKVASMAGTSFISGGRRFGKSALLRSALEQLEGSDVLPILIQIQHIASTPPHDASELWNRLAVRLSEAGVIPASTEPTPDAVAAGIRTWLQANPERSLLLLLDECDFFLKADAASHFRNVAELRDLMSRGRFKVVFSGLQHVARYRKLPNQPLSHLPQPLVIGPLDPSSASSLVRRPLRAMGFAITDAQVDRLVTYCACNPSVIQLACKQLVEKLRREPVLGVAPWKVEDDVLNELLSSAELETGVRTRLFYTLDLDHRYKLLAYLVAWRAMTVGLGVPTSVAELKTSAAEYWPEGFAGVDNDDVRSLCDELVGLGVFAGDATVGYRMLSPATVHLFGSEDEIAGQLMEASENYVSDVAAGAGGSRISLGSDRFSPLTADQLSDAVGIGRTQLRIVVGSRGLLAENVPAALAEAVKRLHDCEFLETTSLRAWRDAMSVPRIGHIVVAADMTGISKESFEQSIEAAQRRGMARTARGTRAAVLVAGPGERWLLSRLVATPSHAGDLVGTEVGLRRIGSAALMAWDRIEELDLAHPRRQAQLLEVTGGWPSLVSRVIKGMHVRPFEDVIADIRDELATPEGARELVAAVGLDARDPSQPGDVGAVEAFEFLLREGLTGDPETLAELLTMAEVEIDPAESLEILRMIGVLDVDDDGEMAVEPVVAACATLALDVTRAGT